MSDIFSVVEEINKLEQLRKEKIELIKNDFEGHLSTYFKQAFDEVPELDYFYIVGYTPSFNDGEPCEHTQFIEFESDDALNENLSRQQEKIVEKMYNKIENIIESVYYTNFKIEFTRDPKCPHGFLITIDDEYDCGH